MNYSRWHPTWIYGALAALGFLFIMACVWFPLTDTDIWWHLAAGQLLWEGKAFLRTDPFCLSSLGHKWVDLHWGFQLLTLGLWSAGRAAALIGFKAACTALALFLAVSLHINRKTLPAILIFICLAAYHMRYLIDVRPIFVTLLGLSVILVGVEAYLRGQWRNPGWILIPVQILLTNTQGLFPLGPILCSLMLGGEIVQRTIRSGRPQWRFLEAAPGNRIKGLALLTLAMWAVCFLNPYGWEGFKLPYALLGRINPSPDNIFSTDISENIPIPALWRDQPSAVLPYLWITLLVLFSFDLARRSIRIGHILIFGAFLGLAWMAQRNIPLYFLVAAFVFARNLHLRFSQSEASGARDGNKINMAFLKSDFTPILNPILTVMLLGLVGYYSLQMKKSWEYNMPGTLETPFRFPSEAVKFMKTHPIDGNIFNELRYGGYLNYHFYPHKLSFVDGRMIVRSREFFTEFLGVIDNPEGFSRYVNQYGITHVLLPIAEFDRYIPLLGYLLRVDGWHLLHCDGASVLLAQGERYRHWAVSLDSIDGDHEVVKAVKERFARNPKLEEIARHNFAELLFSAGRARQVAQLLENRNGR